MDGRGARVADRPGAILDGMWGVLVSMVVSLGSAAALLAVVAKRNAPEGGWRAVLGSGFSAARSKELPLVDHNDPDDGATGGLQDLFAVAAPADGPAYSEATAVRSVVERVRRVVRR